uniref:Uncharacterized protein n=1 Tax=Oryza glumipatula TaxID=40148 RepID=A0A0D9Y7P1_9ORYZ
MVVIQRADTMKPTTIGAVMNQRGERGDDGVWEAGGDNDSRGRQRGGARSGGIGGNEYRLRWRDGAGGRGSNAADAVEQEGIERRRRVCEREEGRVEMAMGACSPFPHGDPTLAAAEDHLIVSSSLDKTVRVRDLRGENDDETVCRGLRIVVRYRWIRHGVATTGHETGGLASSAREMAHD